VFKLKQYRESRVNYLKLKQKPFRSGESHRNRDTNIENRDALIENRDVVIENRVSILDSILDSREDRESSVNLLLNGTVPRRFVSRYISSTIHLPFGG